MDRQRLTTDFLTRNRTAENLIERLETLCTHHPQCPWTGAVSARSVHLGTDCEHEVVECSRDGCTYAVERQALAAHEATCEHRIVPCQHCSTEMTVRTLEEHYTVCTMVEVDCPHNCGAAVSRGEIDGHEDSCPRMPMPCPFAPHGCTDNVLRQGYAAHQVECAVEHAELVAARVGKLSAVLSTTASALEVQAGKIHELRGTVEELEARLGEPSAAVEELEGTVERLEGTVEALNGTVEGLKCSVKRQKGATKKQKGAVEELEGTVNRLNEQQGATPIPLPATVEWQVQGAREKISDAPELDSDRTYLFSADFTVGPVPGRSTYTLRLNLDFSQETGVRLYLFHRGGGVVGEPLQIGGTTLSIVPCPTGAPATKRQRTSAAAGSSGASTITKTFPAGEKILDNLCSFANIATLGEARALALGDGSLHVRATIRIAPPASFAVGMLK